MTRPTVLIVEDNPTTRKMFRLVVEVAGFAALEASSGAAALAQVAEAAPQLVLVDLVLPDMSGIELARRLRGLPAGAHVPVVALSGFMRLLEEAKQLPEYFDAFLFKPVDPARLTETIQGILDVRPVTAPPEEQRGRHIVVVDDDPMHLKLARLSLARHFDRVTIAGDGVAALDHARRERPDLILSDVLMPGLDGFGLCMEVRRDPQLFGVPVVLMSAQYGDPADHQLAQRVGANALVPLQSNFDDVIAVVVEVLSGDRTGEWAPLADPMELLRDEHVERALRQLDRQVALNLKQAQQATLQGAQLSILSAVADALTRSENIEAELTDVLAACLDASGLHCCALYRGGADSAPELSHVVGFPGIDRAALASVFGHPWLLVRAMSESAALQIAPPALEPRQARDFLARASLGSAMFVPLLGGARCVGALLLGVRGPALDPSQLAFGRALGAHLGQALALTDAFARERSARAAAETANRVKDEFLAMLGHELRNPLAPIVTALELMRLRASGTVDTERTVIERQVGHLVRLVDDLLDIARITRGNLELKRYPIELAEVVSKAIETASPLLEQRQHRLRVHVAGDGLCVIGDAVRLAQVVGNLLMNAAKYTEPGGSIEIAAEREGDQITLYVRDSGVGISDDMLPRIFEIFVQGRQTLERSQGGMGLGLAIVRSLVGLHGGSVSAQSAGLGHGSEFTVRLPAATLDRIAPLPSVVVRLPQTSAVLIVDDNQDAAELLASHLTELGYRTCVAHDGPAALRAVADFTPEVAVLDIGLPVMNGYELAQRLRALPGLERIRLVAVTGYGQDGDRRQSRDAGFEAHLVKPIEIEQLEAALRTDPPVRE